MPAAPDQLAAWWLLLTLLAVGCWWLTMDYDHKERKEP